MRTLGIDPGTVSFDLCCIDDGVADSGTADSGAADSGTADSGIALSNATIVWDQSIKSPDLSRDPTLLIEAVRACMPFELAAGPSGYGVPLMRGDQIGDYELALMMLVRADEQGKRVGIGGLTSLIRALITAGVPLIFTPGVIHLPSVPAYRKANRIDMGTADKVCSVAAAIVDQSRHLHVAYLETSFIMLELGGAFSAAMAVQDGKIIDGAGGSSGPMGYRSAGAMDGEVAYLLGERVSKDTIFSGGALDVAGQAAAGREADEISFDEWVDHPQFQAGWWAWLESLVKTTLALTAVLPRPREILLSGRLSLLPAVVDAMTQRLHGIAPVRCLTGLVDAHGQPLKSKSAAQGAALIANGLAGGRYQPLVDAMDLHNASGTALDYLHLRNADQIRMQQPN